MTLTKKHNPNRPSNYPYLSGDTFRDFADHVWDEDTKNFKPEAVLQREIVFVPTHKIFEFFQTYHSDIKNPYILITHNSDHEVDHEKACLIDEKIIHWFGQNVTSEHPKLTPLPIGLENAHHNKNGVISNFEEVVSNSSIPDKDRILYGFRWQNNPTKRIPAYIRLKLLSTATPITTWPEPKEYLEMLAEYKFVASPPGNGVDCIRTWESMYLGVIPIVKKTLLTDYFIKIGLPMWAVASWSELGSYSEADLCEKYTQIMNSCSRETLYADYWFNLISTIEKDI